MLQKEFLRQGRKKYARVEVEKELKAPIEEGRKLRCRRLLHKLAQPRIVLIFYDLGVWDALQIIRLDQVTHILKITYQKNDDDNNNQDAKAEIER